MQETFIKMKSKDGNKVIAQRNRIPDKFFMKFTTVSIYNWCFIFNLITPSLIRFRNCKVTDFMETVLAVKEQILEFLLHAQLSDESGFFNISKL